MKSAFSEKSGHLKALENHIDNAAFTLHSLEDRLKEEVEMSRKMTQDAEAMRAEIERCGRSVQESQTRLNSASSMNSQLRRDHEIAQTEVKALQTELSSLKRNREAAEDQIQECRLSLSKSSRTISQVDRERVSQTRELERFQITVDQLTTEIDSVQEAIARKQNERVIYSDILRHTLQASQLVDQDIRRCEGVIRDSTLSLEKRLKVLAESTNLVTTTEEEMKLVDKQLERLSSELDATNALITDIESREIISLITKRKLLSDKLESLTNEYNEGIPIVKDMEDRMRAITENNDDLEKEVGRWNDKLESLRRTKARIWVENQQLSSEILGMVSRKSAANNELSVKIKLHNTHREFLSERKQEADELEKKVLATGLERCRCESACKGLRQTIERTDKELKGIQVHIDRILKELARKQKRADLRKLNLDRIQSKVVARAKEIEEATKSHDKAKSSLSLEGRLSFLEDELRLIMVKCHEYENQTSATHSEQVLMKNEIHRFRVDLDELKIRKLVFAGMKKRKNLEIAKAYDDEESTRKEISLIERDHSRVGEISLHLRSRESSIASKLRETREALKGNSEHLLAIEAYMRLNEEVQSDVVLLQTEAEKQAARGSSLEASLRVPSKGKARKDTTNRDRSDLVNLIRKLKQVLKSVQNEKLKRQHIAIARVNDWDIDDVVSRQSIVRLGGGGHMASTCSTIASSTLSLSNDGDEVLNDEVQMVEMQILQLKCRLPRRDESRASDYPCASKLRAIGQSLNKVGWNARLKVREQIIEWHKFNESMSL